MPQPKNDYQPHICIIGAGAAGLSAGWYLKQRGYQHVTILEKETRIGGKCHSLTYRGKSFDLGANYITSAYSEVMSLAGRFNAEMYTEGKLRAFDTETKENTSLFKAVSRNASLFKLAWQSLKFVLKRWRLNSIISPDNPGYRGISKHPELSQPFNRWLKKNNLKEIETLFEVPISLMGYGQLSQIPAAYALTYLSVPTFLDLMFAAISPKIRGYPKRLTEGYQRLWERISWELDVKTGARVESVSRGEKITIKYAAFDDLLFSEQSVQKEITCDYIFIATPLYGPFLQHFLTFSEEENKVFRVKDQIIFDPFIVTTYRIPDSVEFFAATYMIPEPPMGEPFVITRQFQDVDLVSFYTRTEYGQKIDKETILKKNAEFANRNFGLDPGTYETFSEFPYFQHISSEAMAAGFYDQLEDLQGRQNTFYVGGLLNFELVETIVNYSKHLVKNHFPKI